MKAYPWHSRPGLAGGLDKDGSRGAELLFLGFGSVEFGTVAPSDLAGVVSRLAPLAGVPDRAAIGIGLGQPPEDPPATLATSWLAGLEGGWRVADYLSFNLSARACRPLLAPDQLPRVMEALAALAARRKALPRPLPLALKFHLGERDEALPAVALAAADAGFDILTAVLPGDGSGFQRLARLARHLAGGPALVAVGGIRNAAQVALARAAGAAGVQVHGAFADQGAACLAALQPASP